jgi:hypothetical protein
VKRKAKTSRRPPYGAAHMTLAVDENATPRHDCPILVAASPDVRLYVVLATPSTTRTSRPAAPNGTA